MIRRTATRLADGRELIYFDDSEPYASGAATRRLDDPRPLPDRFAPVVDDDGTAHPVTGPEMRLDPLTGEWVPMASHRMHRTFLPAANACPLCPARADSEYSDGEIPDTDYDVVVFENRFPALLDVPGTDESPSLVDDEALFPVRPATGRCEVVCFSADHNCSFADLKPARVRTIIEALADRTAELSALPGIKQVFCFENRGKEIGVTLPHPHGQIYGFGFVTPRTEAMLRQATAHYERTGGNLLRDVLRAELRAGTRIVLTSEHWTAYVPAAARWPVEVHLAPNRDVIDLPGLTDAERDDLAVVYPELLHRLDLFFTDDDGSAIPLPYIAGWHQGVVGRRRDLGRLHLQAFSVLRAPGKLKYLAGVESGMATWISDTTPERIAARLREVGR
jgi:UDPglucose--hexose-1-phosphate uridylyltransferase